MSIFRPKTRPRLKSARRSHLKPGAGPLVSNPPPRTETPHQRPTPVVLDPADPRAHWAGVEQAVLERRLHGCDGLPPPMFDRSAYSWSPHLHQGYRAGGHPRRSLWHAPSVDEKQENLTSWRNAQVAGFILGFVCPIGWFVAAFLPLPPQPGFEPIDSPTPGGHEPNPEAQVRYRRAVIDDIRYENARWWRGLNRFMCGVGVLVIAIVVTLAVIGSRAGGF